MKHQIASLALGDKAPPLSFYQPFLLGNEQTIKNYEVLTKEDESFPTVEIQKLEVPNMDCPSENDLFEKIIKIQKDLHSWFGSSSSAAVRKPGVARKFCGVAKFKEIQIYEKSTIIHFQRICI